MEVSARDDSQASIVLGFFVTRRKNKTNPRYYDHETLHGRVEASAVGGGERREEAISAETDGQSVMEGEKSH